MAQGRIEKDIFPDLMLAPFHYACFTRFIGACADPALLRHPCFQIVVGLAGTLHFELADDRRTLTSQAGTVCVLSPGIRHNWHSGPNGCCENFMFFCDGFAETDSELGRVFNFKHTDLVWLFNLAPKFSAFYIGQFRELIAHHDCYQANIMHGLLYAFCGTICRQAGHLYGQLDGTENHPALGRAVDLMKHDYRESLTLEQLSRQCGLGTSRLSELFRQKFGMSPIQYRNELRVKKAMQLLRYSDMNITQIAEYLGFHSLHYFSRFFKQQTGRSPSDFVVK